MLSLSHISPFLRSSQHRWWQWWCQGWCRQVGQPDQRRYVSEKILVNAGNMSVPDVHSYLVLDRLAESSPNHVSHVRGIICHSQIENIQMQHLVSLAMNLFNQTYRYCKANFEQFECPPSILGTSGLLNNLFVYGNVFSKKYKTHSDCESNISVHAFDEISTHVYSEFTSKHACINHYHQTIFLFGQDCFVNRDWLNQHLVCGMAM